MTPETFRLILAACAVCLTLTIIGAVSPLAIIIILALIFIGTALWCGSRAIQWFRQKLD